jgi:hypothetical protein
VCDWDLNTSSLGEFPYDARVPGSGIKTITQENLWDIIAGLDEPGLESFFIADASKLITRWALDVTARYAYCSEFNCPAYEGAYDNQPNWWISAVGVIRQERMKASKFRRK